jgi:hypothetical protein
MRLFAGYWRGLYAGHRRGIYAKPIVKSHFFQLLPLVFNIFYPLHIHYNCPKPAWRANPASWHGGRIDHQDEQQHFEAELGEKSLIVY